MKKQSINIRDKFNFSEVHKSMNATGPVQSKQGVTYFARDMLCSNFLESQNNEIYFLNIFI